MMRTWVTHGLIQAALLAALAPVPALAQQAGVAMTAESGGSQAGCVQWSYETIARPNKRHPQRVSVIFTYRNRCNREIHVQLRSQTAALYQAVGRDGDVTLAPGEVYAPRLPYRNYIIFDHDREKFLNFWVLQSERRFNGKNENLIDMNRCNPNFRPTSNTKRTYPPCPPANSYR